MEGHAFEVKAEALRLKGCHDSIIAIFDGGEDGLFLTRSASATLMSIAVILWQHFYISAGVLQQSSGSDPNRHLTLEESNKRLEEVCVGALDTIVESGSASSKQTLEKAVDEAATELGVSKSSDGGGGGTRSTKWVFSYCAAALDALDNITQTSRQKAFAEIERIQSTD